MATASFGHGVATTILQLAKGYAIIANGGFEIKPSLIKKHPEHYQKQIRIIKDCVSKQINEILRKIVTTKEVTAEFANIMMKFFCCQFIQQEKLQLRE